MSFVVLHFLHFPTNNEKGINYHVDEIDDKNTNYELKSYFSGFPQNLVLIATTDCKHMYIWYFQKYEFVRKLKLIICTFILILISLSLFHITGTKIGDCWRSVECFRL